MTTVHQAQRGRWPAPVYRFLRDALADHSVHIPSWSARRQAASLRGCEVTGPERVPAGYGRFLVEVFDEWVRHDVGTVYVQMFDQRWRASWCAGRPMCTPAPAARPWRWNTTAMCTSATTLWNQSTCRGTSPPPTCSNSWRRCSSERSEGTKVGLCCQAIAEPATYVSPPAAAARDRFTDDGELWAALPVPELSVVLSDMWTGR